MRKSRSIVVATSLVVLLAAAPMHAAPRFSRESDPIGRFIKAVKKAFGMTTQDTVIGPIPVPITAP